MNKFKYLLLAASLFASSAVFTSCDDGDDDNTANPAEEVVKASKKHDTAILLCTFGSTFKESIKTYDATLADFPINSASCSCVNPCSSRFIRIKSPICIAITNALSCSVAIIIT